MLQVKEQGKYSGAQIKRKQAIYLFPGKEFRVKIAKMIQDPRNSMEAWIERIQEMINKDLGELKNRQTVMNTTLTEMKS